MWSTWARLFRGAVSRCFAGPLSGREAGLGGASLLRAKAQQSSRFLDAGSLGLRSPVRTTAVAHSPFLFAISVARKSQPCALDGAMLRWSDWARPHRAQRKVGTKVKRSITSSPAVGALSGCYDVNTLPGHFRLSIPETEQSRGLNFRFLPLPGCGQ
jgi:hypothetical protein